MPSNEGMEEYEVMLDIETLGTEPGSVIINVALIPFDRCVKESFSSLVKRGILYTFDIEEQIKKGYQVKLDTLRWWLETDANLLKSILSAHSDYFLDATLIEIQKICNGANQVWSKGYMDYQLLQYMCHKELDRDLCFFRKASDLRTLTKNASFTAPAIPESMIKHNPLHDAAYQILTLQAIFGME